MFSLGETLGYRAENQQSNLRKWVRDAFLFFKKLSFWPTLPKRLHHGPVLSSWDPYSLANLIITLHCGLGYVGYPPAAPKSENRVWKEQIWTKYRLHSQFSPETGLPIPLPSKFCTLSLTITPYPSLPCRLGPARCTGTPASPWGNSTWNLTSAFRTFVLLTKSLVLGGYTED